MYRLYEVQQELYELEEGEEKDAALAIVRPLSDESAQANDDAQETIEKVRALVGGMMLPLCFLLWSFRGGFW